ncbi:hypothetical protein [Tissierella sp.]|uniref:hypothetical protein n=1 Tax=Tissierella sp. TaxID=41274 RepID=UPI0028670B32|nr:hypothetical protein [Tissierella sp.]MDR7856336.1 hypothetical protein [Tissierella sp.]
MIKSIFYKQDEDRLWVRYAKALSINNLEFQLNYLVDCIEVGEMYDFYVTRGDLIFDNINICVTKIEELFKEDNFDYFIHGTDEEDKELSVKLSNTEFWTS